MKVSEKQQIKRHPLAHIALPFFFFSLVMTAVTVAHGVTANNPDSFETITVAKILLRPKGEFAFSVAPEGYRIGLIRLMRKHGLNALGGENAVFDKDKSGEARFWLGGTIEDITCEENIRSTKKPCELTVLWELLDNRVDEVTYKVRTRYFHDIDIQNFEADFPRMIGGTLLSLLKREKFLSMLKKRTDGKTDAANYSNATIRRCTGKNPLPAGMNRALNATVVVKNGAGTGSGFFISPDGFILTANHVVAHANTVTVKTHAGKEMTAAVVRQNKSQDVAILKIDQPSPDCFSLAKDTPLGTEMFGIGAPAGEELAFSVSKGIVSGKREFEGRQYIQTDTSLNPGNSGGPLVNYNGEVIAVVSWKLSIPGFEGIAFGVPIQHAFDSISLTAGAKTTMSNAEIMLARNATTASESTVFVDSDDPSRWEAIRRERVKAQQAEIARRKIRREQLAKMEQSAHEEKEARRKAKRRRARAVMQKLWFFSSALMVTAGGAVVAGTYGKYKSSEPSDDEFDRLTKSNTGGWVMGGIGLGSIALFYLSGNRLKTGEAETVSAARFDTPFTIGLSGTGFVMQGSF